MLCYVGSMVVCTAILDHPSPLMQLVVYYLEDIQEETHTQMRSTTHYVRSNTPGNNLLFVFLGMSCINSRLPHQLQV